MGEMVGKEQRGHQERAAPHWLLIQLRLPSLRFHAFVSPLRESLPFYRSFSPSLCDPITVSPTPVHAHVGVSIGLCSSPTHTHLITPLRRAGTCRSTAQRLLGAYGHAKLDAGETA
eukprot:1126293-Alexandrium_andersonii.AAC.1